MCKSFKTLKIMKYGCFFCLCECTLSFHPSSTFPFSDELEDDFPGRVNMMSFVFQCRRAG